MNKEIKKTFFSFLLLGLGGMSQAQTTVIPPSENTEDCPTLALDLKPSEDGYSEALATAKTELEEAVDSLDVWKKIECGHVEMTDFPIIALTWLELLFQIATGVAVIMIMVGGVQFMIGSTMEDKDSGKKTISMAILGLIVAGFAAVIVDLVLRTFS